MPTLHNQSPYRAEMIPMIDKDGRTVAVVIAKGTYRLDPRAGLVPADDPEEIRFVDEPIEGEAPGAIRAPADAVDHKPATDVILLRPATDEGLARLRGRRVAIELGSIRKSARVGADWPFGPLRRDEPPRRRYAGTYDKSWAEERMPLLPADFDPRHNQAAPPDLVARGYLDGGERLRLVDLYDGGPAECQLPGRVVIVSGNVLGHYFTEVAALDTVLIWSDRPRVALVWRLAIPCRQKYAEVCDVFVNLVRKRTARELFGQP